MRFEERSSTFILSAACLVLAALVGLIVPLASGTALTSDSVSWTPPTQATETTAAPAMEPTRLPVMPTASATPTLAPPTFQPPTLTGIASTATRRPATATPMPIPLSTLTATRAVSNVTTAVPETSPRGLISADNVNLRAGPGLTFEVIGLAYAGTEFEVSGRSSDSAWMQICCVNGGPAWVSAQFITPSAPIDGVPVAQ